MKRLAVVVPVLLLALAGCAPLAEPADPAETCITVNVEHGLAADRAEAGEFCAWLEDHESLLDSGSFDETFSDPGLAQEWAEAEAAKND